MTNLRWLRLILRGFAVDLRDPRVSRRLAFEKLEGEIGDGGGVFDDDRVTGAFDDAELRMWNRERLSNYICTSSWGDAGI